MAVLIGKKQSTMYHLATEEYLLRHVNLTEDILYLWFGSKAFVFGRNQNPFIEIHPDYLLDKHFPKLRRISGGGTIYEDEGTLNFSIITKNYRAKINQYEYFLKPLIFYLNKHHIQATFQPKSHVFIGEKKISGNAQALVNHRLMHHGTILFDTELKVIERALIQFKRDVKGYQILSNKQKVINVQPLISKDKHTLVNELAETFCDQLSIGCDQVVKIDEEKIQEIITNKYQKWEWNFGTTPSFEIEVEYQNQKLRLAIVKGYIDRVVIGKAPLLVGRPFDYSLFK